MPMSNSLRGAVRNAYEFTVDLLGSEAVWTSAKTGDTKTAVVGFRNLGRDNAEVINAFGPGTVAITCQQKDFPNPPEKFDTFAVNGMVYVVQATHSAMLNAETFGWRVYVTGK